MKGIKAGNPKMEIDDLMTMSFNTKICTAIIARKFSINLIGILISSKALFLWNLLK
jgi:hypothetical protein